MISWAQEQGGVWVSWQCDNWVDQIASFLRAQYQPRVSLRDLETTFQYAARRPCSLSVYSVKFIFQVYYWDMEEAPENYYSLGEKNKC